MCNIKLYLFKEQMSFHVLDVEYEFCLSRRKKYGHYCILIFFMLSVWSTKNQNHSGVIIKNIPLDSLGSDSVFCNVKLQSDATCSAPKKAPVALTFSWISSCAYCSPRFILWKKKLANPFFCEFFRACNVSHRHHCWTHDIKLKISNFTFWSDCT